MNKANITLVYGQNLNGSGTSRPQEKDTSEPAPKIITLLGCVASAHLAVNDAILESIL